MGGTAGLRIQLALSLLFIKSVDCGQLYSDVADNVAYTFSCWSIGLRQLGPFTFTIFLWRLRYRRFAPCRLSVWSSVRLSRAWCSFLVNDKSQKVQSWWEGRSWPRGPEVRGPTSHDQWPVGFSRIRLQSSACGSGYPPTAVALCSSLGGKCVAYVSFHLLYMKPRYNRLKRYIIKQCIDHRFDLAWLSCLPSAYVSSLYLVLYVEFFLITGTSFSLPFSLLSLWDWPLTWKTIILQCYYTVGWVIWPVKSSPKWPIMCRVGR